MTDLRPIYFNEARARLVGNRLRVYMALLDAGPSTPKELAARMGWDVTSVRPRFDDLRKKVHAAELTGVRRNGEHEVRALPEAEMRLVVRNMPSPRNTQPEYEPAGTFRELKQMEIFA